MIRSEEIKMILRRWKRNKLNTFISFVSLSTGLACATILTLYVNQEYNVIRTFLQPERTFLIQETDRMHLNSDLKSNTIDIRLPSILMERYPEIEAQCLFSEINFDKMTYKGFKIGEERIMSYKTLPTFPDFFETKVIAGDLKKTLSSPNEVAITLSFAKEVFGNENPIGKMIRGEERTPGKFRDYFVTTLIDDRQKSALHFDLLFHLPEQELKPEETLYSGSGAQFIRLVPGARINEFEQKLKSDSLLLKRYYVFSHLFFKPVREVYFSQDTDQTNTRWDLLRSQNEHILLTALLIALTILIIASFNYIGLTMTRAPQLIRNIARQRVVGATKRTIRRQVVAETSLHILFSLAIGIILVYLTLPHFNEFTDSRLALRNVLQGRNLIALLLLTGISVLIPSRYILAKINRNDSLSLLKNRSADKSRLIRNIVILQFIISTVLSVFSVTLIRQIHFATHQRSNAENTISVSVREYDPETLDRFRLFYEAATQLAFIQSHTHSSPLTNMSVGTHDDALNIVIGGAEYLDFYGLELLEGRNFTESEEREVPTEERPYIYALANETFAARKTPAGTPSLLDQIVDTPIEKVKVIGIVKDYAFRSFRYRIEPLIITPYHKYVYRNTTYSFIIKTDGKDEAEATGELQRLWQSVNPSGEALHIQSLETDYREMHKSEIRFAAIAEIFTLLSLLLTVLGLFGLAWYTVQQRRKEIALRKINGATTSVIVRMLCRRFLAWVAVAFAIGAPVAYYLSQQWLNTFVYKEEILWTVFPATFAGISLATLLTVITQTWLAASANPAKFIKTE